MATSVPIIQYRAGCHVEGASCLLTMTQSIFHSQQLIWAPLLSTPTPSQVSISDLFTHTIVIAYTSVKRIVMADELYRSREESKHPADSANRITFTPPATGNLQNYPQHPSSKRQHPRLSIDIRFHSSNIQHIAAHHRRLSTHATRRKCVHPALHVGKSGRRRMSGGRVGKLPE